jgi:hypothetical protein
MSIYWLAEFLEQMDNKLPPAEQEYANALIGIVGKYGKLSNNDGNGIWVGYVPGIENDNLPIGVKCANCALYEGNGVCKIVAQTVEDNGYCRLAAIWDGAVDSSKKDSDNE